MPRLHAFVLLFAISILLFLVPAAEGQLAFYADFDEVVVTGEPEPVPLDPPGEPDGDSISITDAGGLIAVVSAAGDLQSQPVLLARNDGPGGFGLTCEMDPDTTGARRVLIRWRSVALTPQFLLSVTFRGGSGNVGSVQYRGGFDLTMDGATEVLPVGYQENVSQQFQVLLDFDTRTRRLWIDGQEIEIPDMNVAMADFVDRIGFEMGGQLALDFAFDDVEILVDDAAVETDERSWGELKAAFDTP